MAETHEHEHTPAQPQPGDYSDTEDYSEDATPDFDAPEVNKKGEAA